MGLIWILRVDEFFGLVVSCTGLLVWGLVVLFGLRVCLGLVVLDLRRLLLFTVGILGACGFTLIRVLELLVLVLLVVLLFVVRV